MLLPMPKILATPLELVILRTNHAGGRKVWYIDPMQKTPLINFCRGL